MDRFTTLTATAAPLLQDNIDTDTIIAIHRQVGTNIRGRLGQWCFGALRYLPDGSENPGFILNKPPYRTARILLAGRNFGCGSSREGAVWAIQELGIAAIIAPSFGDIFFNNCFQNGLLPITLPEPTIATLATNNTLTIDLEHQQITTQAGAKIPFTTEPRRRTALLQGQDEISATLAQSPRIAAFQAHDAKARPWIYQIGDTE